jgi:hypothetical protein
MTLKPTNIGVVSQFQTFKKMTIPNKFSALRLVASLLLAATLTTTTGQASAQHKSLKLVFIRHAERPDDGENLTCAGFNRSVLLPAVLYRKFNIVDDIFVPSPNLGKVTKQARMLETIIPYAIKYNLSINSKFDEDDSKSLAAALLKESGTVVIVWDHSEIPGIISALGIRQFLKWDSDDFDSIWIVTFPNGKPRLQADKEGLNPPKGCPF